MSPAEMFQLMVLVGYSGVVFIFGYMAGMKKNKPQEIDW